MKFAIIVKTNSPEYAKQIAGIIRFRILQDLGLEN